MKDQNPPADITCIKCGATTTAETRGNFCPACGMKRSVQEKLVRSRFRILWGWVIYSALSILCCEYIFASITAQCYFMIIGTDSMTMEKNIFISSIGSLAGIFLGSLHAEYFSKAVSIKESMSGALLEITASQIALIIFAGSFNLLVFVRIALISVVAFTGVKAGEKLKKVNLYN